MLLVSRQEILVLGNTSLGGASLGFLHGTLRLRPAVRTRVRAWDLAIVLQGLSMAPFEPTEEVSEKFLTFRLCSFLPSRLLEESDTASLVSSSFVPGICTWHGEGLSPP